MNFGSSCHREVGDLLKLPGVAKPQTSGIAGLEVEPTRGLEPRTARLQEALIPCIARLALKTRNSGMAVDALRGSRRHEFDDTAVDTPSTVDSRRLGERAR